MSPSDGSRSVPPVPDDRVNDYRPPAPEPPSIEARLAALEGTVSQLAAEIGRINTRVGRAGDPAAIAADEAAIVRNPLVGLAPTAAQEAERRRLAQAAARERAPGQHPAQGGFGSGAAQRLTQQLESGNIESLIGRYGMLALGTITALAAVGTFLGWAIAHGMLNPPTRVGLGLVAAAALAFFGFRLRRRERSYANSLIGLSLAVVHVCAWAAGPYLSLVPAWAAFVLATLASLALAVFAHSEDDEPLWCVGFGGAAIAPFVTATGEGNAFLLAAYGAAILIAGGYALARRPWRVAGFVFLAAAGLHVAALASLDERHWGPVLALALPLVVAIVAVLPVADAHVLRARLRGLGVLAASAALRLCLAEHLPATPEWEAAMIGVAGLVWLALIDRAGDEPEGRFFSAVMSVSDGIPSWIDGAILPLAFGLSAVVAIDGRVQPGAVIAAVSALAATLVLARRGEGSLRNALAFTAGVSVLAFVYRETSDRSGDVQIQAFAAAALVLWAADRAWRSVAWVWISVITMATLSLAALAGLSAGPTGSREAYVYAPFLTRESLTAAVVAAVWLAMLAVARPSGERVAEPERTIAQRAPWLWGCALAFIFFWAHQELRWAWSPMASALALMSYYAVTSVLAVGVGRARDSAVLRHVGLVLGLIAGATALNGASKLPNAGARIAGYLVVSVFLMGIAYWYRRPGNGATGAGNEQQAIEQ